MNIVALSVAVIMALASIGVAAWTWHAMASVDDAWRGLAGSDPMQLED